MINGINYKIEFELGSNRKSIFDLGSNRYFIQITKYSKIRPLNRPVVSLNSIHKNHNFKLLTQNKIIQLKPGTESVCSTVFGY